MYSWVDLRISAVRKGVSTGCWTSFCRVSPVDRLAPVFLLAVALFFFSLSLFGLFPPRASKHNITTEEDFFFL